MHGDTMVVGQRIQDRSANDCRAAPAQCVEPADVTDEVAVTSPWADALLYQLFQRVSRRGSVDVVCAVI